MTLNGRIGYRKLGIGHILFMDDCLADSEAVDDAIGFRGRLIRYINDFHGQELIVRRVALVDHVCFGCSLFV